MYRREYGDFQVSVMKLPDDSGHADLIYGFLSLRKKVFVERMEWPMNHASGLESEQYDVIGYAWYVIAHTGQEVVAGARLIRCDSELAGYSYMIRDAYFGIIDLPPDICVSEPPSDHNAWELTRLVSTVKDPNVARAVLDVSNDFIRMNGGDRCLFLGSPAFLRMANRYGYVSERLGNISGDKSGRFLAFQCAIRDRFEELPLFSERG